MECLKKSIALLLIFSVAIALTSCKKAEMISAQFVDTHLKEYSRQEQRLIQDDLENIRRLSFRQIKPVTEGQSVYVATAGGPGASKSTILETYLQDKPNFLYADPDQRALKFMINTYVSFCNNYAISQASSFKELIKEAYTKWRAASNYIACTILNEAFSKGYNIAHGTTSTAKQITGLYENLKNKKYKIVLLLCGSTDQNRVNAIRGRGATQDFVQNSDEDTIQKGKAFPERFPVYFKYADEIHLYWTETFSNGSTLAATINVTNRSVKIMNQQAYDRFLKQYPSILEFLQKNP